jgi:hypothetical protein
MYFPCGIRGRGTSAVLTLDPCSKAYQAGPLFNLSTYE